MSDLDFDFEQNEQNDPGNLRKAIDKANKESKAKDEALAALRAELNEVKLGNVFRDKGVPAAFQRLMRREGVEASPEAVDKWLADNGDDFGWKPQAASTEKSVEQQAPLEEAPTVPSVLTPEDIEAGQRIQQISAVGVGQTTTSDQGETVISGIETQLGDSGSFDDAVKLLAQSGMFDIQSTIR